MLEVAATHDARDGHPRMTRDRPVAEALTDLERTLRVLEGCVEVAPAQSLESLGVEDVRVLAPLRQTGGELRRAHDRLVRLTVVAAAPEVVGQLGEGARLLERRALLLPAPDRLPDDLDGLGLVVGEVTRAGTAFEELGAVAGSKVVGEAQRPRILGCCLAVGTATGCFRGRSRRELEDGLSVGRLLGVMRDACDIRTGTRRVGEREQHRAVQRKSPGRRDRLLHGHA